MRDLRHALVPTLAALAFAACGGKEAPKPDAAAPTTPPPETSAAADAAAPTPTDAAAPSPADAAAPAPSPDAAAAPAPDVAAAAPTGPSTEVVLWHSYRGKEAEALEKVVEAFNGSGQGVTIRSQAIPYDPFVDKVTITVPAGTGPDLFIFAHNMVGNWVEKGVLEPLSGQVPPETLKEFMPESVKALVYRKNLYGLPLAFKSLVMFYNKKLLPEPPATMEELIPKLQALKAPDRYLLVYQAGGLYFHSMWFQAFGGRVFDDSHVPAFDTPEHLKGLQYVRDLHMKHKILEKGISGFMVTSLFNEGNAVVVFNGPWFLAEIEGPVDYGIAPLPSVEGHPLKPMLGIESVFVTKTSKHKEAALKAAMYLASAASAKVRMEIGRQPVTHLATLEEGAKTDDQMRVFMEQSKNAVLMDASPEMQLLWTPGDNAISAGIFVEDRNPKDELAKAQKKMVDAIGAMQK